MTLRRVRNVAAAALATGSMFALTGCVSMNLNDGYGVNSIGVSVAHKGYTGAQQDQGQATLRVLNAGTSTVKLSATYQLCDVSWADNVTNCTDQPIELVNGNSTSTDNGSTFTLDPGSPTVNVNMNPNGEINITFKTPNVENTANTGDGKVGQVTVHDGPHDTIVLNWG